MDLPTSKPPAQLQSCCHCRMPDIVLECYDRFNVLICTACLRKHEKLISKSTAKTMYLLSDSDLQPLGFIEKENPRHQKWNSMKQYLASQVEEVALAKHGSLEALESEKQRRMQGKLEQRMQKRQAAELEEERQRKREAQLQAVLKKYGSADADSAQHDIDGTLDNPGTGRQDEGVVYDLAGVDVEEF